MNYAVMPFVDYTNTCDEIRAKSGETNAIKSGELANKVGEVYEAGRQAENKAMWDGITANNTRTSWASAFQYWGCEYLRPPYVIAPTKSALSNMFSDNKKLKEVKREHFDFSNYIPSQTANTSAWYRMFMNCSGLETVEDLGMAAGGYNYTFSGCSSLKTIAKLRVQEDTQFTNTFNSCGALEDITIEGTIGQNGFVISSMATKLSKASILSILNACNKDVTASPITITLPKKCIDGATDTEALLESLGGDIEYTAYTLGASTLQLPHTNIQPNTVLLIPVDENGNQTNPDWIDDGNGNIINPWYPEEYQFVGTIDYATGLIDISNGAGVFGALNAYTKCQYTVDSAYNMALSKGYNIAFA